MAKEENDDIMEKIAQDQLDKILLEKAYDNAWIVLSGQLSFEELLSYSFGKDEQFIMAYDPDTGPKEEELENMINFWIEKEEYHKCAKIQKILNEVYPKKIEA